MKCAQDGLETLFEYFLIGKIPPGASRGILL
jgi:hypothetical protein